MGEGRKCAFRHSRADGDQHVSARRAVGEDAPIAPKRHCRASRIIGPMTFRRTALLLPVLPFFAESQSTSDLHRRYKEVRAGSGPDT